ncbi:unnamed protein product, partial [Dovyalis caffra]
MTVMMVDAVLPGWTPIEDLKDKHVVDIAKFAITEYNKEAKAKLELASIVKGDSLQVKTGALYRLVLAVKEEPDKKYETGVCESLNNFKTLVYFDPDV